MEGHDMYGTATLLPISEHQVAAEHNLKPINDKKRKRSDAAATPMFPKRSAPPVGTNSDGTDEKALFPLYTSSPPVLKKRRESVDLMLTSLVATSVATIAEDLEPSSLPHINKLPVEVLQHALSFLPVHTIAKLNLVCKFWKQALTDDVFWRRMFDAHYGCPPLLDMDWRKRCIAVANKAQSLYDGCEVQDRLLWAVQLGYNGYFRRALQPLSKEEMQKHAHSITDAFCLAASEGQLSLFSSLIKSNIVNLNAPNSYGDTAFHCAARCGRLKVVQYIIEVCHSVVDVRNTNGNTPLTLAAKNGHVTVVRYLLSHGAMANARNEYGNTPIFFAAIKGHAAVASLLIEYNAEVNASNNDGNTPLIFAADKGHASLAELLCEKGAEVNRLNRDRDSALMFAAMNGYSMVTNVLLEAGAIPDITNNHGNTALVYASMSGHLQVVTALLRRSVLVNIPGEHGSTALSVACSKGHTQIVEQLLKYNAQVNTQDQYGNTPLQFACANGHIDVVALLLGNPFVDIESVNRGGKTAYMAAQQRGHLAILALLEFFLAARARVLIRA